MVPGQLRVRLRPARAPGRPDLRHRVPPLPLQVVSACLDVRASIRAAHGQQAGSVGVERQGRGPCLLQWSMHGAGARQASAVLATRACLALHVPTPSRPSALPCTPLSPPPPCSCDGKGGENGDSWCQANYADLCAEPVGTTCDTVSPDTKSRCGCCDSKKNWADEDWCQANYQARWRELREQGAGQALPGGGGERPAGGGHQRRRPRRAHLLHLTPPPPCPPPCPLLCPQSKCVTKPVGQTCDTVSPSAKARCKW